MAADDDGFHPFPVSRRWSAKWIWAPGPAGIANSFYLFRRELPLSRVPGGLRLYITADTRYQLHVNGSFVGRGPPQSQPYFQYYDQHDVSRCLTEGLNCVGVIVNYVGNLPDTRGGLLAELADADGNVLLATDAGWRVCRAAAWQEHTFLFRMNKATPYQAVFDARRFPAGWSEAGFDDSQWQPGRVIAGRISDRPPAVAPWTRLVPRDIPYMTADPVLPKRIDYTEECLDIANRTRPEDLSISLSTCGSAVEHSLLQGQENLCSQSGETLLRCSTRHQDRVFDGVHDPCVVLDFGRVITAYPRLELDGVEGGMLDIGYAERLLDGRFNNALEGQFADRLVMTGGRQSYQPFTWKAFRYLKLRLRQCGRPVSIRSVEAVVTTYPFQQQGGFHCSDDTLNGIFDICRHTLRLCSNEFIMDTPWREQGQWLGDVAAVTLGGIYACFGDAALPGKFLRQAAANQQPTGLLANISNSVNHSWEWTIPDYSLWWIMALWNHYLYTGERRWIDEYYPAAVRILQAHLQHVNEYGLIEDMPHWVFIDWADVDKRGECTALNAIFCGALEAAEQMARVKNDRPTEARVRGVLAAMRRSFRARLFDAGRGCFADARIDGSLSVKVSEHANMAAVRWGLCDDETAAAVISNLYEKQSVPYTEAQPFFTAVVLQALDRAGRFDLALEIIRRRWGERMLQRGATSTFEEWGTNGSWRSGEYKGFLRSLSHAWSAHPAEFLIRNLIGLEIVEPGCRKLRLRPPEVPFDYDAAFPTPAGLIRARRAAGKTELSVPEGVEIVG